MRKTPNPIRWDRTPDGDAEPCEVVPNCPVCGFILHVAHRHTKLKICVCKVCGTSMSIPEDAWQRAKALRDKLVGGA